MDENQLAALYQQYLGRAPDPSGIASWSGQDPSAVIAGITGSQEYQNNQANQGGGGGGGSPTPAAPSDPNSQVAQIYQSVLGRAPDAGAQGWIDAIAGGADPQAIAQQIASSQEGKNYATSNPSGQFSGLASLSQTNNPLAGTSTPYSNMQYVGPAFASGESDLTGYQYKDSSGGTVTVDSAGNPIKYSPGQSWYQQQYAAHPDAIRTGWKGQQYLAAGPLDQTYNFNGKNIPIAATEYRIDPNSKALTQKPVEYEPSSGGFSNWMTDNGWMLPLAMAGGAAAAEFLPGLLGSEVGMVDAAGNIIGAGAEGAAYGSAGAGSSFLEQLAAAQAAEDMAAGAAYPAGSVPTGAGLSGNVYGATGLAAILAEAGLSGLTGADLLKYGMPLYKLGSSLLGGGGGSEAASSALGSLIGGTKPPTAQTQTAQNVGYNNTIANLTPGLTKGSQFRFANEPVFADTQTPMPMQAQPDYTQQILNAAQGGLIDHYAEGGEVPEAPSPYLKPELFRGRRFSAMNRFNSAQMPGHQPRQFADGGEVESHDPQFFSEGGLNNLENTYVKGDGDGTSDSVPAMLANGEFVVPADVVSKLGNGSNDAGANVLDQFLATIREHAQKHDPKELPPDSKGPLAYLLDAKRKA